MSKQIEIASKRAAGLCSARTDEWHLMMSIVPPEADINDGASDSPFGGQERTFTLFEPVWGLHSRFCNVWDANNGMNREDVGARNPLHVIGVHAGTCPRVEPNVDEKPSR